MEKHIITSLLNRIYLVNKKYESIAAITGENFNVFKILNVTSSEVRLHSAFIAELLNPLGTHNLKDTCLKAFIQIFKIPGFDNVAEIEAEVMLEEYMGPISEDGASGGRIDIIVKPKIGTTIVIENKIYAGDQHKQLARYRNHYPTAYLLYLTLDGKNPDGSSSVGLEISKDFHIGSYKEQVLDWLETCRKESSAFPLLRETLTQYIYLLKHLTNQAMNDQMTEEITDIIIKNNELLQAAFDIEKSIPKLKEKLLAQLKLKIIERYGVADRLGLQVAFDKTLLGKKESGFWFYKDGWNLCFYFYFDNDFNRISVGIDTISGSHKFTEEQKLSIIEKLSDLSFIGPIESTGWKIWGCELKKWNDVSWSDVLTKMPEIIVETVNAFRIRVSDELM